MQSELAAQAPSTSRVTEPLADALRGGRAVVLTGAGISTETPTCYRTETLALGTMS